MLFPEQELIVGLVVVVVVVVVDVVVEVVVVVLIVVVMDVVVLGYILTQASTPTMSKRERQNGNASR